MFVQSPAQSHLHQTQLSSPNLLSNTQNHKLTLRAAAAAAEWDPQTHMLQLVILVPPRTNNNMAQADVETVMKMTQTQTHGPTEVMTHNKAQDVTEVKDTEVMTNTHQADANNNTNKMKTTSQATKAKSTAQEDLMTKNHSTHVPSQ